MNQKQQLITLCLMILTPLLAIGLWTGYLGSPKSFSFQQKEEWNSPDGKEKIVSFTKFTYPRSDLFDPAGVVRIEKTNESGSVDVAYEFSLHEIKDYTGANIQWINGIPTLLTPAKGWPQGTNRLQLRTQTSEDRRNRR